MPEAQAGEREKRVYEFHHPETADRTCVRAVADCEDDAITLAADAHSVEESELELETTYGTKEIPRDDVTLVGHPFEDGDRIALIHDDSARASIEITVQRVDGTLTFKEETAPYGVQTPASPTFTESGPLTEQDPHRIQHTLEGLFRGGWRRVNDSDDESEGENA